MAMIKNMEMSIAVATNPNEIAFIDVDDLHGPSLSPSLELYMLHELDLFIFLLVACKFEPFLDLKSMCLISLENSDRRSSWRKKNQEPELLQIGLLPLFCFQERREAQYRVFYQKNSDS